MASVYLGGGHAVELEGVVWGGRVCGGRRREDGGLGGRGRERKEGEDEKDTGGGKRCAQGWDEG